MKQLFFIENKEDESIIFRRFTQKEVDQIVKKIKKSGDINEIETYLH